MKNTIFILMAVVLGTVACNDAEEEFNFEQRQISDIAFINTQAEYKVPSFVSNPSNPFDNVGLDHNKFLHQIFIENLVSNKKIDVKRIKYMMLNSLSESEKNTLNEEGIDLDEMILDQYNVPSKLNDGNENFISKLHRDEVISEKQYKILNDVNNILKENLTTTTINLDKIKSSYNTVSKRIKELENNTIKKLESSDRDLLLIYTSVLRHSLWNIVEMREFANNPINQSIQINSDFDAYTSDELPGIQIISSDWGAVGNADGGAIIDNAVSIAVVLYCCGPGGAGILAGGSAAVASAKCLYNQLMSGRALILPL